MPRALRNFLWIPAFSYALALAPAAVAQEAVLSRTWVRDKAGPTAFADSFEACDPSGRFTLTVDNGPAGAPAISSATISVNGVEVLKQSDFNPQVSHIERPLSGIGATNQIAAQLTSAPGGTLAVAVVAVMNCGIKIRSPAAGSTLSGAEVLVQGTLPTSLGIDVGVQVNGTPAAVVPGRFVALVPIDPSVTGLTAIATNAAGTVLSKDAIPLTVLPATPAAVRLQVSPAGGLAPLPVQFQLANDTAVAQVALDFDGDGTVDFTGAALDGVGFTYSQPGLYLPTLTATDATGKTYTSTVVLLVSDRASLEALLQARWNAMKDALRAGDIAAAGQLIFPRARARYVEGFTAMAADLPGIDAILTPVRLVRVRGRVATLEMIRTDGGIEKSFEVRCVLDEDGNWRLWAF